MTPLLGYAQFHVTANRSMLRTIHRWSGRITLLLIALTLLSGFSLVGLLWAWHALVVPLQQLMTEKPKYEEGQQRCTVRRYT